MIMGIPNRIIEDIGFERERQEYLRENGKFKATCATRGEHQMTDFECFVVLAEEHGEVARAVCEMIDGNSERGRTHLRKELIEEIAVAVAWLERIDAEEGEPSDNGQFTPTIGVVP